MLKELIEGVNLSQPEKLIAVARGNGPSFDDLQPSDREVAIDKIMLRIAAICGCALPNTSFFAQIIADEISTYITDHCYGVLTVDEIILAFRFNSARSEPVVFTGVCVNVDFIAKVLRFYGEKRTLFENRLKNKIDGYEL